MIEEVVVVLVLGDDWSGVYFNGKIVQQGHSICIYDLLDDLQGKLVTSSSYKYADLKWLHSVGKLPDRLEDVKFDG